MRNIGFILFSWLCVFASGFSYEIRLSPPEDFFIQENKLYTSLGGSSELINDEFKEYLRNGITIHYTYFIDIMRKRFPWSELLERRNIQKALCYDIWKKKYIVTEYTPQKKIIEYSKFSDATVHFLRLREVHLLSINAIDSDESYFFKTRVTVKVTQLKSYFHVIFSLLSVFKYKTTYLISDDFNGEVLLASPVLLR